MNLELFHNPGENVFLQSVTIPGGIYTNALAVTIFKARKSDKKFIDIYKKTLILLTTTNNLHTQLQ